MTSGPGQRAVVGVDTVARVILMVPLSIIVLVFADETDWMGPGGMLVVVLACAYIAWNVWFVWWLRRRVAADSGLVPRTLSIVGFAAAARLVWLLPVVAFWSDIGIVFLPLAVLSIVTIVQVMRRRAAGLLVPVES